VDVKGASDDERRLRAIHQVAGIILGLFGLAVMGEMALKAVGLTV
jgi:hypothetical protein